MAQTLKDRVLRESDPEETPPQPPDQMPSAPVKEPPEGPKSGPGAPVREPGPAPPKKCG
jgi:hypothetical protein